MQKTWFLSLLTEKYGEKIVNNLLNIHKFTLIPENIKPYKSDPDGEGAIIEQMSLLSFSIDELKAFHNEFSKFSFDFPGWIGVLDFDKTSKKDIMILGLEPHIEDYYYQICYEFSEIDRFTIFPHRERHFWIRTKKPGGKNNKKYSTDRLWDIMFRLFSSHIYIDNHTIGADDQLKQIMEKFYITDLCHFAPRGKASKINEINNWHKIRENVAKKFLIKEICLINPKLIIAQRIDSMKILQNIFENMFRRRVDSDGTYKNLPCKGKCKINGKEIDIFFVPHTSRNNAKFWNHNNIECLRKEFSEIPGL